MTSTARSVSVVILACALLAACGGAADDRSRGDGPTSAPEVTAAPSQSELTAPTTEEPTTPEPAGPTNLDELVPALQALPNVVSVEGEWASRNVDMDALNQETILAVAQMMSDAGAAWTDESEPSVLLWGPSAGESENDFTVQIVGFEGALSAEGVAAFAAAVDLTDATALTVGVLGGELHATVPTAAGTDWYPGFLQAYDGMRAAAEATGVDLTRSSLAANFDTGMILPEEVPLSLGDALQDPAWPTILEQINAAEIALAATDSGYYGSPCEVEDGPSVVCGVTDPSLETIEASARTALETLRSTVEGAGYTFTLD